MTPLSPAQREALARQDAPFLARGLVAGDPRSTEAHLRHAAGLLGDRRAPSPAGQAAAHIATLFENSITPAQTALLACRAGCAFCCHQPVSVTAPEAFLLAAQIAPDRAAAMADAARAVADRRADAPKVAWFSCPLLDEGGACTAYAARPIACRAHVSVNVEDCKTSHPYPGNGQVMEPKGYTGIKDHCRVILLAAMRARGLPLRFYEMNAAVTIIRATAQAEARWLDGEDIFAALPAITPLTPQAQGTVEWLAQTVAPTL